MDSTLMICQNIDTVSLFGINRRRLTMLTINPSPYYDTNIEYWIKGIGSTLGFFNSGHLSTAVVDQADPKLFCCHKGFDQIYQDENSDLCHESQVSLENVDIVELNVFPNPTMGDITVVSNKKIDGIILLDLYGKKHSVEYDLSTGKVSLQNINKGFYFLKIVSSNNDFFKTLLYE